MAKVTLEKAATRPAAPLYYIHEEERIYYIKVGVYVEGNRTAERFISLATGEAYGLTGSTGRALKPLPEGTILRVVL